MQALGQLRYANAVQALSDQLSYYQKGPTRMAALEGLAGIGHPTSVVDLRGAARELERRHAAAGASKGWRAPAIGTRLPALQQMGQTERSTGVLLALHYANVKLGEVDGSLQQIVASLRRSVSAADRRWIPARRRAVRRSAPRASRSKDQSADVRRLIADVLGFSRNPAVFPALAAAAKDADPDVAARRASRPSSG